jgi:predicted XRE-type DNA-binding protein
MTGKPVRCHGDAVECLRDLPDDVRDDPGYQLYRVQLGLEPADWKSMPTVGLTPTVRSIWRRCARVLRLPKEDAEDIQGRSRDRHESLSGTHEEPEMSKPQTFATAWDAIRETPEEPVLMKLRADAMIAITARVQSWKVTQREAAKRLGVTQPRLNDLLKGKVNRFSLDALMEIAPRAGLDPRVEYRTSKRHKVAA